MAQSGRTLRSAWRFGTYFGHFWPSVVLRTFGSVRTCRAVHPCLVASKEWNQLLDRRAERTVLQTAGLDGAETTGYETETSIQLQGTVVLEHVNSNTMLVGSA